MRTFVLPLATSTTTTTITTTSQLSPPILTLCEHAEHDFDRDDDFHLRKELQPLKRLLLRFRWSALESDADAVEHRLGTEGHRRNVMIEHFAGLEWEKVELVNLFL